MANNYNAQPRPAVILVDRGTAQVIIARETWATCVCSARSLAGRVALRTVASSVVSLADHGSHMLGDECSRATDVLQVAPGDAGDHVDRVGIGLLGYGTVGSGVGTLLARNAEDIRLATGRDVYLRRVLEKDPGFSAPGLDPALLTTRFEDIIEDPEIDIVVELIGGAGAALDFQRRALRAGKHV